MRFEGLRTWPLRISPRLLGARRLHMLTRLHHLCLRNPVLESLAIKRQYRGKRDVDDLISSLSLLLFRSLFYVLGTYRVEHCMSSFTRDNRQVYIHAN